MDIIKTLFGQAAKNIMRAPGWIPLVVVCYLLFPLVKQEFPDSSIDFENHKLLIVSIIAAMFYVLGDALDKAVFPRDTNNGPRGWKWLALAALNDSRNSAFDALRIERGGYEVAKSLSVSAGEYTGSVIQVKNELAKFIRSIVLPITALGFVLMLDDHVAWGASAVVASPILLLIYGRLKAWHMCDLYEWVEKSCKSDDSGYSVITLNNDIRLFFWKGKLASSAINAAELKQK